MNYNNNFKINEGMFTPNSFHKELAKEKKLLDENGDFSEKYYLLQYIMQYFIEKYLEHKINLKKYDDCFLNSDLDFNEVDEKDKDIYQLRSLYHYYYLRNTLYVEKLTLKDLEFLLSCYESYQNNLSDEMIRFIEKNLEVVISSDISLEVRKINYGPPTPDFFAPVDSIVLGFRYDIYGNSNENENWLDTEFQKKLYLQSVLSSQMEECEKNLDIPLKILVYDDFSVKKIDNLGKGLDL